MARPVEPEPQEQPRGGECPEREAGGAATEDAATACLRFASGALGSLLISSAAGHGEGFAASRVYGSAGVADLTNGTVTREDGAARPLSDVLPAYRDESIPDDPFAHAFAQLQQGITGSGGASASHHPGEAALDAMAVIFACLEAALTGRLIDVADVLSGAACAYEDSIEVARLSRLDPENTVKPVA